MELDEAVVWALIIGAIMAAVVAAAFATGVYAGWAL